MDKKIAHPVANAFGHKESFIVLETTERSQTAVMTLAPGASSSDEPNRHAKSDQILIVLEGEITGEIAEQRRVLRRGDSLIVPAGTPHKFNNTGTIPAVSFTAYAPPAYPPNTRE